MIKPHLPLRRLLTLTTAMTLAIPALPAFAQEAAPPARVGQISSLHGNVSFEGSGSGGWAQAALNYPVTSGDTLYTQDSAQAAIAVDTSNVTLAADTELQVTALDDNTFDATQSQGEAAYAINDLQPGQDFTITTPRGTVAITQNGQYDIIAGDASNPTTVNVFQGAATVTAPGASLQVPAGQAAFLSGTDQTTAQLGQAQRDSFSNAVLAQNEPPAPPSYAPPVVQQMTGTAELSQYGSWNQSPQYGAVWYPNVGSGWAPYRNGYWTNVQPWGWTWVEAEPWGFAPFHYGRWVDDGNRWGWAPAPAYSADGGYGPQYQPVYAPAVVSFFGVALATGITAAALSSGSVGWVPLAPNEPYYPSYRAPSAYIRQINYVNVRNISTVNVSNNYSGSFAPDKLANRRGATYVPAAVMSKGEHVGGYAHPAPQTMLASARPVNPGFGTRAAGQPAAYRLPEPAKPLAQIRPGTAPKPTEFAQRRTLPPATVSHAPFAGHPGAPIAPHEAMAPRGAMAPHEAMAPMPGTQAPGHPDFATTPGYHAPPAPPAPGEHLGTLPPAQNLHPAAADHPMPQYSHAAETPASRPPAPQNQAHSMPAAEAYRPPAAASHAPAPAFHPQPQAHPMPVAQAYHPPVAASHPAAPAYHPPAEAARPAAPAYHPPVEAPRPPVQAFHPAAAAPHPEPAPHAEPVHAQPVQPQPMHVEPGHPDASKRPG